MPSYLLQKLQRLQNSAVRIISRTPKTDHISSTLYALHWLNIDKRIQYKNGLSPSYLSELIVNYHPQQKLQSALHNLFSDLRTRLKNFGDKAFSVCAPNLWNSLPNHIENSDTLSGFKAKLKTYLFTERFAGLNM